MDPRAPHALVAALVGERHEQVDRLLAQVGPGELSVWAARNGLSSVLFDLGHPDGSLRPLLHDDRRLDAAADLHRARWLGELLDSFARRGISVYGFKGCGVAHLQHLYPRPDLRPLGDVDLLFDKEHTSGAIDVAREHGFRLKHDDPAVIEYVTEVHYNAALVHPQHGYLELHNDLYRDIPSEVTTAMLTRARDGNMYGRPVRILDDVDLFVLLAVHLGITQGEPLWIWLEDLRRLARTFEASDWGTLHDRTAEAGEQVFVHLALQCLQELWGVPVTTSVLDALQAVLSPLERRASVHAIACLPRVPGDRLSLARRLSGRPVRGALGVWSSLFCHPGVVCTELGVRSDSRWFWAHRIRHVPHRAGRAVRALLRRRV